MADLPCKQMFKRLKVKDSTLRRVLFIYLFVFAIFRGIMTSCMFFIEKKDGIHRGSNASDHRGLVFCGYLHN